ncbi:MAG: molybdopterin-dependent oxidoreductase [Nitrospirae bacterium]|nr:molybdopterin-dependent oxidoreductase [Nitrospirota bacterium]
MITVTINGKDIKLEKPVTVFQAARQAGIKIPALCYHEELEQWGGCRLCLVEIEKMPKLQAACTAMVADGMVVRTESEIISKVRRGILEFILINHPLDCPYCDKAGECELQDLVHQYGATAGRYTEPKMKIRQSFDDPILSRNMERCIVCTRCVRMCDGVQGASAIYVISRGNHSVVEPFSGGRYDCEYCGNCLTVCPVGAILSRLYLHSYRPWQIDREVETICGYCGVGCTLTIQVRSESINRIIPKFDGRGVNRGLLCSRGRFGYEFVDSPDRLTKPLIRIETRDKRQETSKYNNSSLEKSLVTRHSSLFREVSWDEAIGFVAKRLKEIKDNYSGDAIGGIASARCTNEDNYVFQKFMRAVLSTNNIDSTARLGYAGAQRFLEDVLGQGITSNIIPGLKNSDTIFVLGGDPTAVNPILGLQIRAAAKNGSKVIIIGSARGLEKCKSLTIIPPLYQEADVLERLLKEIVEVKGLRGEKQAIENWIKTITPNSELPGLAPRSGAGQTPNLADIKEMLLKGQSIAIVLGREVVQRSDGHRTLAAVAGLTYILEARLYLLSERPNEQGLMDAGCLPDMLPGFRHVGIGNFRRRFDEAWGVSIPEREGMSLMEMIEAVDRGSLKALYVMGENPVFNLPNSAFVENALKKLDFLVVQDIFLTETAKLADVVFPTLSWSEKDGTYTNLERRIQRLRRAVMRDGMEDWKIISEISKRLKHPMLYASAEDVFNEISELSPLYYGLTYKEIDSGKAIWPYRGEPLRGEVREVATVKGPGRLFSGKLYLSIEKPLFHSGTLSRRAGILRQIYPDSLLKIAPEEAARLGLSSGQKVRVSTKLSSMEMVIDIDPALPEGIVTVSNNFEGLGAYRLLGYVLDPVTRVPGIEGWQVSIEKI